MVEAGQLFIYNMYAPYLLTALKLQFRAVRKDVVLILQDKSGIISY